MHYFAVSLILSLIISFSSVNVYSQEQYKELITEKSQKLYTNNTFYNVEQIKSDGKRKRPKNVILMIGDGMGVSHIYAGMTANNGQLYIKTLENIGFCTTFSKSDYVTDSAASGTAIATGKKTNNGAIGVDENNIPIRNIREMAEDKGMATGVVSTSAITHATPASFVAHQPQRKMYEEIAEDFLKTNIDVFIGGGYKHFSKRKDNRNLIPILKDKGYKVIRNADSLQYVKTGKLAGLTAWEHNSKADKRNNMLMKSSKAAIEILKKDKDGFFLMIEGSMIDWGSHIKSMPYTVNEVLDFDKVLGEVLRFAAKDQNTLVIVTADHETGGLACIDGDFESGMVKGKFATNQHTGQMVPVFAFGPGAELFKGFMDNTDIPKKIAFLLKLD